jgi:hypothetical protein
VTSPFYKENPVIPSPVPLEHYPPHFLGSEITFMDSDFTCNLSRVKELQKYSRFGCNATFIVCDAKLHQKKKKKKKTHRLAVEIGLEEEIPHRDRYNQSWRLNSMAMPHSSH